MRYEYKYVPLESIVVDEEYRAQLPPEDRFDYDGHLVVEMSSVQALGADGYRLVQVVVVDGVQHGWFIRPIPETC